jgi:hypothetical protein
VTDRLIFLLLVAYLGSEPGPLHAQEDAVPSVTATPSVGFAMVPDDGRVASGGLTMLLELELRAGGWAWGVYGEARGIGVGCEPGDALPFGPQTSDRCDVGGQAVGVSVSRAFGAVAVGGGLGGFRQPAGWHVQPHGQLSVSTGVFRFQVRFEVPKGTVRAQLPILVGIRLPLG